MNVSRRTAELALVAIDSFVLKRSRHNGGAVMTPDLKRALDELHAAAAAFDVSCSRHQLGGTGPSGGQWLSVGEAARQLGVSTRTVERRAASALLPAQRVGNHWIIWNERGTPMAKETTEATAEAPPRYRVAAEYITVKTAALAGILPGRSGLTVIGVYRNGLLPVDVPVEDVERLLRGGYIEKVAA